MVGALEGRGHLPLRPHPAARRGLLHRHPAADGERQPARRATSSPTPTPTWSPASSGCAARPSSTRWAGTTTACRPSVGCRTTSACAATRRCPTTPTSPRPRSPTRSGRSRSAGPTSSRSASGWSSEDEEVFEELWRTLGLSVDWKQHYTTIGPKAQTVSQRPSCATSPAARPTCRGADAVGRHVPDRGGPGRARGPRVRRRLPPGRLPPRRRRPGVHRDHPPRADPQRGGADRAPRRRALPGAVRHHGDLAGLRRRDPGRGAPGRRDRQGLRHRHVLHLRRPDRRHLVARAATCRCAP